MPFGSPLFWTHASKQPFPNRSLSLLQVFVPPLRLKVSSLPSPNIPNRFGVLTPSYSQSVVSHSPLSMYTFSSEWPIDRHPEAASLGPQRLLREHGSRSADVWPELWTGYPFCCLYGDTRGSAMGSLTFTQITEVCMRPDNWDDNFQTNDERRNVSELLEISWNTVTCRCSWYLQQYPLVFPPCFSDIWHRGPHLIVLQELVELHQLILQVQVLQRGNSPKIKGRKADHSEQWEISRYDGRG